MTAVPNPQETPDKSQLNRMLRHYNIEVAAMFAISAALFIAAEVQSDRPWYALAIPLAATAMAAAAYFLIGLKAWKTGNQRLVLISIIIQIIAVGISLTQGTISLFLPIIALIDITTSLNRRREVTYAIAGLGLAVITGIVIANNWNFSVRVDYFPTIGLSFIIAGGGAIWMARSSKVSLENAKLVDDLRTAQHQIAAMQYAAGETAERERLAGEIHDTLAQGFTSVKMQAHAATLALERGNTSALKERLAIIVDVAQENLAEARGLIAAYAPLPLRDTPLTEALHRLGDRWARETSVRMTVSTDDFVSVNPAYEVVLYRVAQEALNNVQRHAGATNVLLTLQGGADSQLTLEVADNGRGIPDDLTPGFGLTGMRIRVEAVGGTLAINPNPNGGTAVCVVIPNKT